jgi:S1-C subfamily serine protease
VKAKLRIVSGARAGFTQVFAQPSISVGRDPSCELQFDPEQDLDVSARHAVILVKEARWYVRDAESRNGTFVNGHRIAKDTPLDDTDQIRLGPDGPVVEFRLVSDKTADGVVADQIVPTTAGARPGTMRATSPSTRPRDSTTQRIRVEVGRQTRRLRRTVMILAIALITVAGGLSLFAWRQAERRAAEYAALQAETDSVLRAAEETVQSLRGEVEGLGTRLRSSQTQVSALQQQLTAAHRSGQGGEVQRLTRELEAATQNLRYQQAAAAVDFRTISRENQDAIALVWVEFQPGEVYTASAFAVRPDGYLVTNRHVVAGEQGTRQPTRIAVRFADSRQTYPGRLVAASREVDLALIKVDVAGGVPTVQALSARPDTLRQGDPVALIGFPLGIDLPMSDNVARTSLFAGTVSKALANVLQIDGYGAEGSSGSPIFDEAGEVVGVLYGGEPGSNGRIVYGVPSNYILRLLNAVD